jgi:hypothetical protein
MLKRVIVAGCLILLFAGLAWSAEDVFLFPEDMQKLMPADPAFIVAVTSVNDLDRQWRAIEEMLDDGSGEHTDLVGMLSEHMPQFADFADMDRPLAFVMGLPDLMGGQEPAFTFIVPLTERPRTDMKMILDEEGVTYAKEGDYLAFSMDPLFAPAAEVPDLIRGLSPGFITARLDLEMVIAAYRPLAEMGLGSMTAPPADPDTTETGEIRHKHGMDPGDAEAITDLAQIIMDSARRLDLALQIDGETLTLHSGFAVSPGSPLDPGPQPSFEDALQLTRLLPPGGNIVQTMALDQTRQFEVFRDFYVQSMEKGMAQMPPEQGDAYRAWMESYLDSIDIFTHPLAASITMSEEGMAANLVMECADAPGNLERIAGLFEGLTAVDIGIGLKKMPTGKVAGVDVRSWIIQYDAEKLAGLTTDPVNPKMSGAGRMEAEQMIGFLRKVTPNINMAARGDHLILSADTNPANLAHMIQEAGQRRGAANPDVAAVAAKAGPACQQVVTGDLMSILAWVTEWMEEMDADEYAAIEGNPIPFSSSMTIDGAEYGGQWTMDMPAVQRFIKAMQEIEAWEGQHHDDEDDGDNDNADDDDDEEVEKSEETE